MRWLLRILVVLVVLVLLGVAGFFLIPSERIARLATAEFTRLTGRELRIDGAIRPTIWPILGVATGPVTMSNADWSEAGPMLSAESLAISVDLASLMSGQVRITEITAESPKILLERGKDGRENWVFGGDHGGDIAAETPGVGAAFALDIARATGATLIFVDHQTGARTELSHLDVTFQLPSFTGQANVDLGGQMNAQDFKLIATIGSFKDFLDGKLVGLKADLTTGAASLAFTGDASLTGPEARGQITADLGNLSAISALAGAPAPALPKGLGAGSVVVSGDVTLTANGSVHLRGASATLDGNALTLDADLSQGQDRPFLTAKLTAGALDLSGLTAGSDGAPGQGWSETAMDLSALGALDAEVSIAADSLDLGLIKAAPVRLGITVDRARMVTDLRKVGAYGGAITGNFVINARKGLSMGGDLTFSGMDLQPLLTDFAGVTRLTGKGDLAVKFVGSGNSMAAIMKSLDGDGRVTLGAGEIQGLDIEGMITNLDPSYVGAGKKTVYDDLTASFALSAGNLVNEDLVLNSPYLKADGKGRLGLGARDIDYRIRATALRAVDGTGGVGVPVVIRGPWSDPSYALDLEALAQEKLDEELAKAENEAKAKLEAELERLSGGQVQDGESLEDAAKRLGQDVIEDEAVKALEKLLGGGG